MRRYKVTINDKTIHPSLTLKDAHQVMNTIMYHSNGMVINSFRDASGALIKIVSAKNVWQIKAVNKESVTRAMGE